MYSIGHVIYGIPITEELSEIAEQRDEELGEEDGGYFTTMYHGGSHIEAGYLGVELTSFDECESFKLYDIVQDVTEDQMREVSDMFHAMPEDYKQAAPEVSLWVVWSTS